MRKYLRLRYFISFLKILFYKIIYLKSLSLKGIMYYIGRYASISIEKNGQISLEGKVYISNFCEIQSINGSINIGYNTFLNTNCKIISMGKIEIGENCLFGPNVCIYDHNHNYNNFQIPICKQGFNFKSVNIGSNVWVGANCFIGAGVKIEDNVIIAANSVVTKDLKANGIYAGNPCKLLKSMYPSEDINFSSIDLTSIS